MEFPDLISFINEAMALPIGPRWAQGILGVVPQIFA